MLLSKKILKNRNFFALKSRSISTENDVFTIALCTVTAVALGFLINYQIRKAIEIEESNRLYYIVNIPEDVIPKEPEPHVLDQLLNWYFLPDLLVGDMVLLTQFLVITFFFFWVGHYVNAYSNLPIVHQIIFLLLNSFLYSYPAIMLIFAERVNYRIFDYIVQYLA